MVDLNNLSKNQIQKNKAPGVRSTRSLKKSGRRITTPLCLIHLHGIKPLERGQEDAPSGKGLVHFLSIELRDVSKSGKERPWKKHKLNNKKVVEICGKIGRESKAQSIKNCANYLVFSECPNGHGKWLLKASFCRDRFCNICTWRKSLFLYHQFLKIAHKVAEKKPDVQFLFLTLTLKNCDIKDLRDNVSLLNKSYTKFLRYKAVKTAFLGTFRTIETTYNPLSNTFHPHIHAVVSVKKGYFKSRGYLSQKTITEMFKRAAKVDYNPICHVERVKAKKADVNTVNDDIKALLSAGAEAAKYPSKVADILAPTIKEKDTLKMRKAKIRLRNDPDQQAVVFEELVRGLSGRQLVAYTGVLRDAYKEINATDVERADLVVIDGNETPECTCPICQSELVQIHYPWTGKAYVSR